ncbi:hypothetical protein ACLBWX_22410 [Methylobacterium sp. M6A4_1b]
MFTSLSDIVQTDTALQQERTMGRKLGLLEIDAFLKEGESVPASDARHQSQHSHRLQVRIAEVLGLPVDQLRSLRDLGINALDAEDLTQSAESAMNHDCIDLIEAYTRISDPDERQRLLKIVRDAGEPDSNHT